MDEELSGRPRAADDSRLAEIYGNRELSFLQILESKARVEAKSKATKVIGAL